MKHTVKRKGQSESFDERKIYASVYSSCLALRTTDREAELIAEKVTEEVIEAIEHMREVSSDTIHQYVVDHLKRYHPAAAYLYDTHKDIS